MAKLLAWLVTQQKNVYWVHQVHSKPSRSEQSRLLSPRAIYFIWGLQLRKSVVLIAGGSWLICQLETWISGVDSFKQAILLKLASKLEVVEAANRYLTNFNLGCLAQGTNATGKGNTVESPTISTQCTCMSSKVFMPELKADFITKQPGNTFFTLLRRPTLDNLEIFKPELAAKS